MLDIERIISEAKQAKTGRILIQFPEGLKTKALELVKPLEQRGLEVIIDCDPEYGGCDLRDREAKQFGAGLLVHVGHSDFGVKSVVPVHHEEWRLKVDPRPALDANKKKLKEFKRIGLVTTLQYLNSLKAASGWLQEQKIKTVLGTPLVAKYPGQILGCDFSAATEIENVVDAFLYIGSGRFHPLGLVPKTTKPVLFLDFDTGKLEDLSTERDKLLRIRAMLIEEAKVLKKFGILVSTKPGQMMRVESALSAKKKLEQIGKQAWILAMDEILPDKIMGMGLDVLVNTACPRLSEDREMFSGTPVISVEDIGALMEKPGKKSYE